MRIDIHHYIHQDSDDDSKVIRLLRQLLNITQTIMSKTQDRWEITNGVAGINSYSRHVVYVGGTDSKLKAKDTRTPEQIKTLTDYVIKTIVDHPTIQVAGHNQFANKDCPSFSVPLWLTSIGVNHKNIYTPAALV